MTTRRRQGGQAQGFRTGWRGAAVMLLMALSGGCGVVGPPIPPEDVGLARKIEAQKERERAAAATDRRPEAGPSQEPETPLPPITPMGPH